MSRITAGLAGSHRQNGTRHLQGNDDMTRRLEGIAWQLVGVLDMASLLCFSATRQ
jgi:hypothetical protein